VAEDDDIHLWGAFHRAHVAGEFQSVYNRPIDIAQDDVDHVAPQRDQDGR